VNPVIWLCQNCAKLVDNDPSRYEVETLKGWKKLAEGKALTEIECNSGAEQSNAVRVLHKIAHRSLWLTFATLVLVATFWFWQWKQSQNLRTQVAAAVLKELSQQDTIRHGHADFKAQLDFQAAFQNVAKAFNITPDEARRVAQQWADKETNNPDLTIRAKAAFLSKRFAESAQLSDQAADEKLAELKQITTDRRRIISEAIEDFLRSADSLFAIDQISSALSRLERADKLVSEAESPLLWATVQSRLGLMHFILGLRASGENRYIAFTSAQSEILNSLKVFSGDNSPEEWAVAQNNLGSVLRILGRESDGPKAFDLLEKAIKAYKNALAGEMTSKARAQPGAEDGLEQTYIDLGDALLKESQQVAIVDAVPLLDRAIANYHCVLTDQARTAYPDNWATAQNNLAAALCSKAQTSDGAEASKLLKQAADACRAALTVQTEKSAPKDWAGTKTTLGNVLRDQASRTKGEESVQLLKQSAAAYREALKIPDAKRAVTQSLLAVTLCHLAVQSDKPSAYRFFSDAVLAYQEALKLFTRDQYPQEWAVNQMNLGITLRYISTTTDRVEAVKALEDSDRAISASLEIWKDEQSPYHLIAIQNLAVTKEMLRQRTDSN
jgi:hypothetical protein